MRRLGRSIVVDCGVILPRSSSRLPALSLLLRLSLSSLSSLLSRSSPLLGLPACITEADSRTTQVVWTPSHQALRGLQARLAVPRLVGIARSPGGRFRY